MIGILSSLSDSKCIHYTNTPPSTESSAGRQDDLEGLFLGFRFSEFRVPSPGIRNPNYLKLFPDHGYRIPKTINLAGAYDEWIVCLSN